MAIETSRPGGYAASTLPLSPVAFDGVFGWFSPGISRRGVVLCGTHGYEQLSAHRPWRGLAGGIAATGCATLSIDYPGTGDSGDAGADSVEGWLRSVRRAIRYLREEAGVEEIVLVGLRLGGTLAALAAEGERIDRLILLAPFATGRAYLREMTMQARTIGRMPDGSPLPQEPGQLIVGGFPLVPALTAELATLALPSAERAPAPDILLIGAESGSLGPRYTALGARVTTRPFPSLAALVANPLYAEAPKEAFAAAIAFAAEGVRPRLGLAVHGRPLPPDPIRGEGWREEPSRFGPSSADPGLFGILCRPGEVDGAPPMVLFVNAGTNVHSGWGRQTTRLARELARDGVLSLRMDLRGIGDSPDRADGTSPLYTLAALDDVRAALDHLQSVRSGPIVIVGACSGAYLAFQAVCREERLKGAVLVNPYCFDWNPADDVDSVIRNVFRNASTYAGLLKQGAAWRRLARGEIRIGAIARAISRAAIGRVTRRLAFLLRPRPAGGTVAQRIAALLRRGAHLELVYSEGDRGLAALHEALGRSPARIARCLGGPVTIVEGADHDLSPVAAQARMAEALRRLLARVH
ncbi:alpha/beta fold hydrolase [Methylobacterium sp. E-045]|uniref:alpha/beta fold hydrolase n=1 Tax=Methylobacterium sp. E-045 TaxID=2836575 RepID=UPI001FB96561|nr:alpha/beta fold hydrolase [Methylobacterium sp. E-045]MCJ2130126.1 alpha/beta fold hydrolase [Methylobacterium sp. E-045]